jgi:hypothetical protein
MIKPDSIQAISAMAVIEILGSGTSNAVPAIGCRCCVFHSTDPLDNRIHCAGLARLPDGQNILIGYFRTPSDIGHNVPGSAHRYRINVNCM